MGKLLSGRIYNVLMKEEVYLGIYLGVNSPRKTKLPHSILLVESRDSLNFIIYRFKDFRFEKENVILKRPYPVEPTRKLEIEYYKNLLERRL